MDGNELRSLAADIRVMADDLKYGAGIMNLFTGALMDRYLRMKTTTYGLNRAKMEILHTLIVRDGQAKPSDLSRSTFRSKQGITRIIDSLEKDGLVKRILVGQDRRTREVSITQKGLGAVRNTLAYTMEICSAVVPPNLRSEEVQQMNRMLRQVRRQLMDLIDNIEDKDE
jgi:DNA-binding MarR family transcriptional regulator